MDKENFKKAYEKATWLCSKSEKCSADMLIYLNKYELSNDEKADIVAKLVEEKYVDDRRYALAFASDKFKFNKWGKIKISYELKRKNINSSFIDEALEQINEEEYMQVIKNLILQRRIVADNEYEYSQKVLRYMLGKGYEPELVDEVLKSLKK
ncbi:MAG: RecX family transcriptional regulator [Bacteroidales bacterium]|nr:RecX family transcriptional regulator [Bacteroidales bacterium]